MLVENQLPLFQAVTRVVQSTSLEMTGMVRSEGRIALVHGDGETAFFFALASDRIGHVRFVTRLNAFAARTDEEWNAFVKLAEQIGAKAS